MADSENIDRSSDVQEIIAFIKSIKVIDNWIQSFEGDEEKDKAEQFISNILLTESADIEYRKSIDYALYEFSKERDDAIEDFYNISLNIKRILALKSLPDYNKAAFARLYSEAIDFTGLYRMAPKNYVRSNGGWRQYAKNILGRVMLAKLEFSKPLILKPADMHKIIARTYGDLVSLQNVSNFMRGLKRER